MSIQQKLKDAVAKGRLCVLELAFESDAVKRTMLLHPEIQAELRDDDLAFAARLGRLRGDLEMFVKGQTISMSFDQFKHRHAYMGLLHPPTEGTWDIRSRDPKPGLRVFGRFPCQDVFVGLVMKPRSRDWKGKRQLGDRNSLEYHFAMIETQKRWSEALPEVTPVTGGNVHDYISEKVHIV